MKTLLPRCSIVAAMALLVTPAIAQNTETLTVNGDTATILRDRYGTPHVWARTLTGLYYANGYAVAQDRLGQMELNRRAARGELAEILGARALAADKETRVEGYSEAERDAQFKALPTATQELLQAYADGVNAWRVKAIAEHRLPKRMTDLGDTPVPWRVTDSIAVGQMMARRFGGSEAGELRNLLFIKYLKMRQPKDFALLLSDLTWKNDPQAPVTLPDADSPRHFAGPTEFSLTGINVQKYTGRIAELDEKGLRSALAIGEQTERVRLAEREGLPIKWGSYGMAVMGSKSVTGNAILVGGPQMGWESPPPQIAHEIDLHGPGIDVTGMGFAGAPGILIGHSNHVAWTFTSGLADFADIFDEKLNPADPHQYWYKGAWREMEHRTETILVKGSDPVQLDVFRTVHGPVLEFDRHAGSAFAVHASYWRREMDSLAVYQKYYVARSAREVIDAAAKFPTSFNTLVADQDGNIGYRYCGYAFRRAEGIDPRFPTPGTGEYDWKGYIPADQMPHGINPKQGFFCSWNNKPASWWDNGDTPFWGAIWHSQRIADVLRAKSKLSTQDVKDLLRDIGTYDITGEYFVPMLLQAATRDPGKLTPAARDALVQIASWSRRNEDGNVGTEIYDTWLQQVREDLFLKPYGTLNPLGSGLAIFNLAMQPSLILHVLQGAHSPVPARYDFLKGRTADDVLITALNKTTEKLTATMGPTMQNWHFVHALYNIDPLPGFPSYDRGTYIQIIELSKPLITGVTVLAPGQNENADNPHYADQLHLAAWWWFKPMLTQREDIERYAQMVRPKTNGVEGAPAIEEMGGAGP